MAVKAEPPVAVASTTGSLPRTSGEGASRSGVPPPARDTIRVEVGVKRPHSQLRSPSPSSPAPSTSTADGNGGSSPQEDERQPPLSLGQKLKGVRSPRPGFAKLEGEDFDFYLQKYCVTLGRNSSKGQVDVDLGDSSKNVSRKHAEIKFNFAKRRWEVVIHGKNGVFLNDKRYVPGGPTDVGVSLKSRDKLEVGGVEMYFLTALDPNSPPRAPSPPLRQAGTRTTRHGVHRTEVQSAGKSSRPVQALPSSLYEEILDSFIPGWTVDDKLTGSNNIQRTFFAPWGERFRSFVGVQRAMRERGHEVELPNAIAHQAAIRNEAIRRLDALLAQGKSLPPMSPSTQLRSEWVQCSLCEKWRRMPDGKDGDRLPDDWCCGDIEWDPPAATCKAPQEPGCPMAEDEKSPDKPPAGLGAHGLTPR